ncbi:GNAT family N-acetyltransferase, partial [Streptomyces ureilyticus]
RGIRDSVRPEWRGRGVTERLFACAVEWAWEVAQVERVRLFVHERNSRAEGFYRKFGFVPSGESAPVPGDPGARELEFVMKGA